ncbi:hypothetical protein [Streptomyces sp. NPDC059949]|uniref:hypothetical protein n=1 Tax=Streptomyces sp. NPDC059949 TaxID=3347013 RepID=UPI00365ECF79
MALRTASWDIDFRPWGWTRIKQQDDGPTVYVQFQLAGTPGHERFDMRSVVMQGGEDEPLSGRVWRRIPFSVVENLLARTNARDMLTRDCDVPAPSLETLAQFFEATGDLPSWTYTTTSDTVVSNELGGDPPGKFPRVTAPEGRLTDDFLKEVADAYRWFTAAKQAPAPAIAQMASVPVRTVHRWVYEARKRDILPPARSGRAG